MATEHDTQITAIEYTHAQDTLNAALTQSRAMAFCTYADAGPSFRNLNDELQDEYMWALGDRINAAYEANKIIQEYEHQQRQLKEAA